MKRSLSLILALTMLFALCACGGQQAADAPTEAKPESAAAGTQPAETQAAAPAEAEPAPAGPEKNYVKKEVPLLMEKLEIGVGRLWVNELKSQGPVRPSLDRVTQYRYDEHGDLIEETQSLIPEQNAFFTEDGRWAMARSAEFERGADGGILSVRTQDEMAWTSDGIRWATMGTATFENGRITKIDHVYTGNKLKVQGQDGGWNYLDVEEGDLSNPADTVTFEYDENGVLRRETKKTWIYRNASRSLIGPYEVGVKMPEEPLTSVLEYDEEGRCTYWREAAWGLVSSGNVRFGEVADEYRWRFDGEGNPVALSIRYGDAEAEHREVELTMAYDGQGRMVSGTKTVDGVKTEYRYEYDESGSLASTTRTGEGGVIRSDYVYNEEGLLTEDRRTDGDVFYRWTKDEYGNMECEINVDYKQYGRSAFRSNTGTVHDGWRHDNGEALECRYVLQPSAVDLEPIYVESETYLQYVNTEILAELTPEMEAAAAENAAALAAYYPPLGASYCGVPVPTPSGSERLTRAEAHFTDYRLNVAAAFDYGEDGRLLQASDFFDPAGNVWSSDTTDGQGRPIEKRPTDMIRITYQYGDDPERYTMRSNYNGNVSERVCELASERIPSWIGTPYQEEHRDGWAVLLNEDGLVARNDLSTADGTAVTWEYSYRAETYEDGSLKAVIQIDHQANDFARAIMEFDRAGYLTFYQAPGHQEVRYFYE